MVRTDRSRGRATVFTSHGSYSSPQAYVNGLVPAMWVAVAVLGAGSLVAALLPFSTRASAVAHAAEEAADKRRANGPQLAEHAA